MINIHNFYTLVAQPNGNETENCLTTFKPKNGDSPLWYDRPCNDTRDGTASQSTPGHKFMCESNAFPDPIGKIFHNFKSKSEKSETRAGLL